MAGADEWDRDVYHGGKYVRYGSGRLHRNSSRLVFLSGGTWDPQALVRSQEGVLAHAVLPNQEKEPEMPASRRHGKRKPPDPVRFGLIYSGKTPK